MGICSSCLGGRRDIDDDNENQRLLFDDSHNTQYGSFGEQQVGTTQIDPQDAARENEALQKVVAKTSRNLVDIFPLLPHSERDPAVYTGQDEAVSRYQHLLSKVGTDEDEEEEDWLSDGEHTSSDSPGVVKPEVGPLFENLRTSVSMR